MRASLGNLYAGIVAVVHGRVYGRRMALSPDIVRWVRGHIVRAARAGGRALVKAARPESAPKRAADYPEAFLRSLRWLALYKEVER